MVNIQNTINSGKTVLGIEFGSTRIKAVLIDERHMPIASGSFEWENRYENGIWTYHLDEVWKGLQESFRQLSQEVLEKYDTPLKTIGAIGFSAMMHGYMAFDKDGNLLVPFRTWRNTMTGQASEKLTELFQFNIPQRWSIAHLYQAMLNQEPHVKDIHFLTTLAGYIHWKLTGQKVQGVGEASGMFPIDSNHNDYDKKMVALFDQLLQKEFFGKPFGEMLQLSFVEGLYLLKKHILEIQTTDGTILTEEKCVHLMQKSQPDITQRLVVFQDLKQRGLLVKTGFKFGAHFRAYSKHPEQTHAEYLIHVIEKGFTSIWAEVSRAVRLAHSVNKEFLFACIDGKTIEYIRLGRLRP